VLTLLGVTAVIVFVVVVVPKLGSSKSAGFRNLIIVLTANFQASLNFAVSHCVKNGASSMWTPCCTICIGS
jgi:hypothetical protein